MNQRVILLSLLCAGMLLVGCQSVPTADPATQKQVTINQGYALLYDTISQETQVDKILILKKPGKDVSDVLTEIAQLAQQTKKQLDTYAKADASLGYDKDGLPPMESASRKAVSSDTTRTILFSGGKAFEFNMLLSQYQAMNYVVYLSESLAKEDPNDTRKTYMTQLAKDARALRDQVIKLLQTPYVD